MSTNDVRNERHEERPAEPESDRTRCCGGERDVAGGCGDMGEMMRSGPCAGFLKRHRLAFITALTVAGLGLLVMQAGWVLGIIAFFRTF